MTRNLRKLVFVILVLILVINEIRGLSQNWYHDSDILALNVSSVNSYSPSEISDYAHISRKVLSKGSYDISEDDVVSRTDGKIIFPSDEDTQLLRYRPSPIPRCVNSTFCENSLNYPNDFVEAVIRKNKELKFFSGTDMISDVVHRVNVLPEDSSLCESYEKVVYPKVAQNKDKNWLFVVNQGDFIQGVRVETCGKENGACNLIEGFAEGYKTTCKQKYIYRQLVAVSMVGQIKPEMFRFPASCCCHIKFTGNPLLRSNMADNKNNAEFSTSKAQRK